jgi:hypothetical protein
MHKTIKSMAAQQKAEATNEFTREDIIAAFKLWNERFLSNPEGFTSIKPGSEVDQADYLLECLKTVKVEDVAIS